MKLSYPVDRDYPITSPFGDRTDPINGLKTFHGGVDIGTPMRTPIYAMADGVVTFSGIDTDGAHGVKVDHGEGFVSWYWHLDQQNVSKGQRVSRYELVGLSGATGRVTGAHLHAELRLNNKAINISDYWDVSDKPNNKNKILNTQPMATNTNVSTPADFIDAVYRYFNSDVDQAVKAGIFPNGANHFARFGVNEVPTNPNRSKYRFIDILSVIQDRDNSINQVVSERNDATAYKDSFLNALRDEGVNFADPLSYDSVNKQTKSFIDNLKQKVSTVSDLQNQIDDFKRLINDGQLLPVAVLSGYVAQEQFSKVTQENSYLKEQTSVLQSKLAEATKYKQVDTSKLSAWQKFGMFLLERAKNLPLDKRYKVAPQMAHALTVILGAITFGAAWVFNVRDLASLSYIAGLLGLTNQQLELRIISVMKQLDKQIESGEIVFSNIKVQD